MTFKWIKNENSKETKDPTQFPCKQIENEAINLSIRNKVDGIIIILGTEKLHQLYDFEFCIIAIAERDTFLKAVWCRACEQR